MKKIKISRVAEIALLVFVALLPLNIGYFLSSGAVVNGFFNPYAAFWIDLSDLVFLVAMFFVGMAAFCGENIKFALSKRQRLLVLFAGLFVASYFVSILGAFDRNVAFYTAMRSLELFVFFVLVVGSFLDWKKVLRVFLVVMGVMSVLGLVQYLIQGSLGLNLLGESVLGADVAGVAKIDFGGQKFVRAYGLFGHPNVFAGYLVVAFLLSFLEKRKWLWLLRGLFLVALVVTFSRSALLALVLGGLIWWILERDGLGKKLLGLGALLILLWALPEFTEDLWVQRLSLADSQAIWERMNLMFASMNIFEMHPFGVGAGSFTSVIQDYQSSKLMPWLMQPVHNIYLLILNELGIQGFIAFGLLMVESSVLAFHKSPVLVALLALMAIGVFDHYLISLEEGRDLLWLTLSLAAVDYR